MTRDQLEAKKVAAQRAKDDAEQMQKDGEVARAFIDKAIREASGRERAAEAATREAQTELDKL